MRLLPILVAALTLAPAGRARSAPPTLQAGGERALEWQRGPLGPSLVQAGERGTHALVYFWAEGSAFCANLWAETLSAEVSRPDLEPFVLYSADASTSAGAELMRIYGVTTLPTVLLITSEGEPDDAVVGYHPQADVVTVLRRVLTGIGTVSDFRAQVAGAPGDLALRYQLAQKLLFVGRTQEGNALVGSIRSEDPQGRTLMGARLGLWDQMAAIQALASGPEAFAEFDVAPMSRLLAQATHPEVLFEGWNWIATVERERGAAREARTAAAQAWPHAQPNERVQFWTELASGLFWNDRDALTSREKKLGLEITRTLVADADALLQAGNGAVTPVAAAAAYEALARMSWLNGRRSEARAAARRALELDPSSTAAQATRDLVAKGR